MTIEQRIAAATSYIEKLGWTLAFVHGTGSEPKAPMYQGWPDLRPTPEIVQEVLNFNYDAGIGVNLGASGLVDVEGDSPEAESLLEDICKGLDFPCWASRKSKHRLFLRQPEIDHLHAVHLKIEFRTGRHQSVLPPSVIGDFEYRWLISPFEVAPPPLPVKLLAFYEELKRKPGTTTDRQPKPTTARWRFRDNKDYILRKFDLKDVAEKAGMKFVWRSPDGNGNIPCYVPARLRAGRDDHHASGVFNVINGVLRDFATGQNHLFFHVMAALTGEPWQDIASEFEAEADAARGRPHSRRISVPAAAISEVERQPLEDVRADLSNYYDQELSRPPQPKTIHIIKGPPGVGKTYGFCKKAAQHQKKAIILTLENKLARVHEELLRSGGADARRMPVLRETGCPHPDEYEATSRRGFKPSQSFPCRKCPIGVSNCAYLLGFGNLETADQLCAAAIYHTHDDFYSSHGNEDRPLVVFDENCLDLILAPVSNTLVQWRAFAEMLKRNGDDKATPSTAPIQRLIEWLAQIEHEFSGAVGDDGEPAKFKVFSFPPELHVPAFDKDSGLEEWLNKSAYMKANREVKNLYGAAVYLIREPGTYVLLERIKKADVEIVNVRFRQKHSLPDDKETFILDATANEEMIRAIAPGWEIKVWDCPPIEQKGQVIQIMDYDISRNRIRKEIAAHSNANPAWLVQVLDQILEQHGPARLISFKNVTDHPEAEMDILSVLKHKDKITGLNNFPCRGHTFEDKTLIVLGTPYKDQASIWELAMAIWGAGGIPKTNYTRRPRDNGWFVSKNMEYGDLHLKPIHDFVVSADLVQAIGRVRPLQNDVTVFVVSNASISDWEVQQFTASELFDMRQPLRKDSAFTYSAFTAKALELLSQGTAVSNAMLCDHLGMPRRTGQSYWTKFKLEHQEQIIEGAGGTIRPRADHKLLDEVIVID